jgi:DNA helicase-2/ATP-dependent DNA helicase PcrA
MSFKEAIERDLSAEQKDAVLDPAPNILCLACAGSGKSRTLAYRIARLIVDGVSPQSIVAFTFTEKAAESIKRRVSQALSAANLSPNLLGAMYIGTIHSYCQNILGQIDATYRQFDVLDGNRLTLYLISRYPELGIQSLKPRARGGSYFDAISKLASAWQILHDEMLNVADVQASDEVLGKSLNQLSICLERDEFIDFSLMIRKVVDALQRGEGAAWSVIAPVKHLMVDEYQDVSPNQEQLVRLMRGTLETLFVVGDDDQSIYGWRGAEIDNILSFERRYVGAKVHKLSTNYRSSAAIVSCADGFIAGELGPSRIAKAAQSHHTRDMRELGVLWFESRDEEAEWVANRISALIGTEYTEDDGTIRGLTPADFAILMRSTRSEEANDDPRHAAFTRAMRRRNIEFSLEAGGGPFDQPQVSVLRDAFGLLREGAPNRDVARLFFDSSLLPAYPAASFDEFVDVLTRWSREIHTPRGGARRRVYPQSLVHELLGAFGIKRAPLPPDTMRGIGLFSRMIQDVESVYMSVDSPGRFQEILNFLNNAAETGYDVSTEDVLQRPDAVTIATVHKVKGLEYPVVFVVDAEQNRFPGTQRKYEGWIPPDLIQSALDRGCYRSNPNEEARLFYTAVTRAESFLYVTGARILPGGKNSRKPSNYSNRLQHSELVRQVDAISGQFAKRTPRRRVDEAILPTSFSEIRYYLRCPMDYRFRQSYGFSPPVPDMFGFGRTVHTAVEKLHEQFKNAPPTAEQASDLADSVFHLKHVPQSGNPSTNPGPYERAKLKANEIVRDYVRDFADDFDHVRQLEARFEVPAKSCLITGAIDLLIKEEEGKIVETAVIDFKAIEGGRNPEDNEALEWTELALQVQLYAKGAQEVLGENAKTGAIHLLKDNQRVQVPVDDIAIYAAVKNVEWAVSGILAQDFPMRPHRNKCRNCDFNSLCSKTPEPFQFSTEVPPAIHLPNGQMAARCFSLVE